MEKLNLVRRHTGWSGHGALWLTVMVSALWLTGWALHGGDADALAELSDAERQWRHMAAVVHGLFSWVFCVVAGRWMWPHVQLVWKRRASLWIWGLGLSVAGAAGLVALTGLGLLYGAAAWHGWLSAWHWAVGLIWPALCVGHAWRWISHRPSA